MEKTLQVNERPGIQKWDWIFERIMWAVFFLIVTGALLGLFGSGYFSKVQAGAEESDLKIQYERFLRAHTTSEITFEISTKTKDTISLWVEPDLSKSINIEKIMPEPGKTSFTNSRMIFSYDNIDNTNVKMQIVLQIKPVKAGTVNWQAGLGGGTSYKIKQFIYP